MGHDQSRFPKSVPFKPVDSTMAQPSTPKSQDTQSEYSASTGPEGKSATPIYSWHEGRKYEGNGLLPVDEIEIDRVNQQHFMLGWAFNGNFQAPIQETILNGKVLESGCGPGTWTLEMAQEWCQTQFYAIDDYLVAPQTVKPANSTFYKCDFSNRLPFDDIFFDFVYQRLMGLTIKRDEWKPLIKELARVCKEGAWIQLVEIDFEPQSCGPRTAAIFGHVKQAMIERDLYINVARDLPKMLKRRGLVNTKHAYTSIPIGWGGLLGNLFKTDIYELLMSFKPWLSSLLMLTEGRTYEQELDDMLEECVRFESYFNFHYSFGQRPLLFG